MVRDVRIRRAFTGVLALGIAAAGFDGAGAQAPQAKSPLATEQEETSMSPDNIKWKRQVIQPDRRVVQFLEYDAPVDRAELRALITRLDAISAEQGSEGKARYWYSALCGNMTNRMNITVEFPNVVSMAQGWQRIHSSAQFEQWEKDARAAGLVLRSQMMLDQIGGAALTPAPAASPDAPPRVLQFLEMDTNNDADGVIKAGEILKKLTNELKVDREQRTYQMDFVGERPRINELLIEYASLEAMQRGNLLIDNHPVLAKMMTSQGSGPPSKRVSECVMTEMR